MTFYCSNKNANKNIDTKAGVNSLDDVSEDERIDRLVKTT